MERLRHSKNTDAQSSLKQLPGLPSEDLIAGQPLGPKQGARMSTQAQGLGLSQHDENSIKAYDAQKLKLDQTVARLQAVEAEKAEIQKELNRATSSLLRLRDDRNYKVDDNALVAEWKALSFSIKNWAASHFDTDHKGIAIIWPLNDGLSRLVADFKSYLKSPRFRQMLIQSFVWSVLGTNVFKANAHRGLLWAGNDKSSLRLLRLVLRPSLPADANEFSNALNAQLKEYFKWRATTTVLLEPTVSNEVITDAAKQVATKVLNGVKSYANERNNTEMSQELLDIVLRAISLDLELNKQRAEFSIVNPKTFGHLPNPEKCEWEGQNPSPEEPLKVHLILAPALCKRGDMDGDHYEIESILVKAQVLVESPPDMKKPKISWQSLSPPPLQDQLSPSQSPPGRGLSPFESEERALSLSPTRNGVDSSQSRNNAPSQEAGSRNGNLKRRALNPSKNKY